MTKVFSLRRQICMEKEVITYCLESGQGELDKSYGFRPFTHRHQMW